MIRAGWYTRINRQAILHRGWRGRDRERGRGGGGELKGHTSGKATLCYSAVNGCIDGVHPNRRQESINQRYPHLTAVSDDENEESAERFNYLEEIDSKLFLAWIKADLYHWLVAHCDQKQITRNPTNGQKKNLSPSHVLGPPKRSSSLAMGRVNEYNGKRWNLDRNDNDTYIHTHFSQMGTSCYGKSPLFAGARVRTSLSDFATLS